MENLRLSPSDSSPTLSKCFDHAHIDSVCQSPFMASTDILIEKDNKYNQNQKMLSESFQDLVLAKAVFLSLPFKAELNVNVLVTQI